MIIRCENVGKTIRGVEVLRDISITMESGKVYGFWGKNGCGKTMLMRVISGLIRPTTGKVFFDDKVLWKDISFPESMGIMIENPAFLNEYTGYDNLKILASIKERIGEREIRQTLTDVGLDPDDKRKYRKYSLGMKQRLGVACAVMEKPAVVILDEPINALDESGVELVRKLFTRLKECGSLVIVACHDREEMNILADEIFVMGEGRIERKEEVAKDGKTNAAP